jgi:FkbM family methyltransferase
MVPEIKNFVRPITARAMRPIAARAWSRAPLNVVYRHLGWYPKTEFYGAFHQAFQPGSDFPIDPGSWTIDFAGKTLKLPLVPERMWLDWLLALATLGIDQTVKKTYAAIVSSSRKPDLFLDVGANYGTHSLLFLAHGIRTWSFEPNARCYPYFIESCGLNAFNPHLERVAISSSRGQAKLYFPEHDTWYGTISDFPPENPEEIDLVFPPENREAIDLVETPVELRTLDDYYGDVIQSARRILIKIDTEGHELDVLRGASMTLGRCPLVLFETYYDAAGRGVLFDMLAREEYRIFGLPWSPDGESVALARESFLSDPAVDYIAMRPGSA